MHEFDFHPILILANQLENHPRDLLVAVIAIGLGLSICHSVFTNNSRCFELGTVKTLDRAMGRTNTRMVLYGLGGLCFLMGIYLIAQVTVDRKYKSAGPTNDYQANIPTGFHR